MALDGRINKRVVDGTLPEHLVVRDELPLYLLQVDHVPKLDVLASFAEVAGMTSEQFSKAFEEDAADAMIVFIEGLNKISEEGGNVFAVLDELTLADIRVKDSLLRASGAGDKFRESLEVGTEAWRVNTALTDEAAKRYDTVASKIQVFKNRLSDVALSIGEEMLPQLSELIEKFSDPATIESISQFAAVIGKVFTFFLKTLVGAIRGFLLFKNDIQISLLGIKMAFDSAWLAVLGVTFGLMVKLEEVFEKGMNNVLKFFNKVISKIIDAWNRLPKVTPIEPFSFGEVKIESDNAEMLARIQELSLEKAAKFVIELEKLQAERSKIIGGIAEDTRAPVGEDDLDFLNLDRFNKPKISLGDDPIKDALDDAVDDVKAIVEAPSTPTTVIVENLKVETEINVQELDDKNIDAVVERISEGVGDNLLRELSKKMTIGGGAYGV